MTERCPPPCPRSLERPQLCFPEYPTQHQYWQRADVRRERDNHWCPTCRHGFDARCDAPEEKPS